MTIACMTIAGMPLSTQAQQSFSACFVPNVGALYLIKLADLPAECLAPTHVEVSWGQGGGQAGDGAVTSITAGDGLLGGTITGSGTLEVDFGGPGSATTAARSDHNHKLAGSGNVGVGNGALLFNASGIQNTALGSNALRNNATGSENTAVGAGTMDGSDVAGGSNTGLGAFVLRKASGSENSAVGARAMSLTTTGFENSALGAGALRANTSGAGNTAVGFDALSSNTGAYNSTAIGAQALLNSTSSGNTSVGSFSMHEHSTGANNTALGRVALYSLTNGARNVALGDRAGDALVNGSDNIYIGNRGAGSESGAIRIGGQAHEATFLAGISGQVSSSGVAVFVNSSGRLGTLTSSVHTKEAIEDLADTSRRVMDLRPVKFRYRPEHDDGSGLVQYGLIAEEVAATFPELAAYGPDGEPETVRYHLLPALLLNELQRQEGELAAQRVALSELRQTVADLTAALEALEERLVNGHH